MKLKFFIGCLLMAVLAFGVVLGMAYCSGRWYLAIGPQIGFPKVTGLMVWVFGFFILLSKFGNQGDYKKYLVLVLSLSIALSLIFFSKAVSRLMIKVYVIGFERAVFSVASPEQWSSVPMSMKKNRERLTEREILNDKKESPPDFVWKVYPGVNCLPYTPNKDKLIVFMWRGWSFDQVLEVGDLKSYDLGFNDVIYQKNYSNNISFLLLGGDD